MEGYLQALLYVIPLLDEGWYFSRLEYSHALREMTLRFLNLEGGEWNFKNEHIDINYILQRIGRSRKHG